MKGIEVSHSTYEFLLYCGVLLKEIIKRACNKTTFVQLKHETLNYNASSKNHQREEKLANGGTFFRNHSDCHQPTQYEEMSPRLPSISNIN